jgi:hypothetical protein
MMCPPSKKLNKTRSYVSTKPQLEFRTEREWASERELERES